MRTTHIQLYRSPTQKPQRLRKKQGGGRLIIPDCHGLASKRVPPYQSPCIALYAIFAPWANNLTDRVIDAR